MNLICMKKHILDLRVTQSERVGASCVLLRARLPEARMPQVAPGQFAQLRIDGVPQLLLRRPISIHDVDYEKNEVSFLVQEVGEGTRWLTQLKVGDALNVVMPLGHGFTTDIEPGHRVLLIGGGVGVAPLLYLGKVLKSKGCQPIFLLGGRTANLILRLDAFRQVGEVHVTTEDGSLGEKGFVTQHSILRSAAVGIQGSASDERERRPAISRICTCGPRPMMMAVARFAREHHIPCEISLENRMACGVGACLCCVENTTEGHKCVCTEGPVFDANLIIEELKN